MSSPSLATYHHGEQPFGFTRKLRQALVVSQSQMNTWIEEQKAQADAAASVQQAEMAERQARIDQGVTNLLALQMEHGLSVEGVPVEERDEEQKELQELRRVAAEKNERTEELRKEHNQCKEEVTKARRLKKEASQVTTVDDLTRGIVNYKYLGLDFEKAGEDLLRFCFTSLDPKDPARKFWFELDASDDAMNVPDCKPPLDLDVLDRLVTELNATQDMLDLVLGMRQAFVQTVESPDVDDACLSPASVKLQK